MERRSRRSRWALLRRAFQWLVGAVLVLGVLAVVADVGEMLSALSGGGLTAILPTRVPGPVIGSGMHGGAAPLPVVSSVTLTIEHASVAAVLLTSAAAVLGGLTLVGAAVPVLLWLRRIDAARPFGVDLSRLLLTGAVVLAVGTCATEVCGWLATVSLAGTAFDLGGRTWRTTVELPMPDLALVALAGGLAAAGWLTRSGARLRPGLESAV